MSCFRALAFLIVSPSNPSSCFHDCFSVGLLAGVPTQLEFESRRHFEVVLLYVCVGSSDCTESNTDSLVQF